MFGLIKFYKGPIKIQMAHKNLEICMYLNGIWAIDSF